MVSSLQAQRANGGGNWRTVNHELQLGAFLMNPENLDA